MRTLITSVVIFVSLLIPVCQQAQTPFVFPSSTDGMLTLLDRLVEQRQGYVDKRWARVDSLRKVIAHTTATQPLLDKYFELGQMEFELSSDSAIVTANHAIAIAAAAGDSVAVERFKIFRALQFFDAGSPLEGLKDLDNLRQKGVDESNRKLFARNMAIILVTMGAFFENESTPSHENMKTGGSYARQWAGMCQDGSPEQLFARSLMYMSEGKPVQMAAAASDCAQKAEFTQFEYTRSHIMLAEYYWAIGRIDEAIYHYAVSAIANVYNANLEGLALLRLGELLYSEGDTARAHLYLAAALQNAVEANLKFNLMRINNAYMEVSRIVDSKRHQMFYMLGACVLVLLVMLVFLLKAIRDKKIELKTLRITERKLARANLVKETYITEFLNLSSSYIEILEEYNKMCSRKLTAGQLDSLRATLKDGKVLDEARKKFYDVFDAALFHLLPDFVDRMNDLLLPDKKFDLPAGVLNTELRLAALLRLGIGDVTDIARFLGIAPNTIYTYRNKLRSRAIDRTTMEDDIRAIGAIENP